VGAKEGNLNKEKYRVYFMLPPKRVPFKRITLRELIGWNDKTEGWKPYLHPCRFNAARSSVHMCNRNSSPNAYSKLQRFLATNKDKLRVVADVGAANVAGAPMAKKMCQILGPNATVYAVDIFKSPSNLKERTGTIGERSGPTEILLAIQRKPLPVKCDAIMFAQTSHWMDKKNAVRAIKNIWSSLKPGGYLLGATEYGFEGREMVAESHHQYILKKVRKTKTNPLGFVEIFPKELRE